MMKMMLTMKKMKQTMTGDDIEMRKVNIEMPGDDIEMTGNK